MKQSHASHVTYKSVSVTYTVAKLKSWTYIWGVHVHVYILYISCKYYLCIMIIIYILCFCRKSSAYNDYHENHRHWCVMWKTLRNYAQIWIYVDINVDERLNILYLPPLALFRENLYKNHFLKIMSEEHHQLHSLIPERQSGHRRHPATN